jgi:hypothetical protein
MTESDIKELHRRMVRIETRLTLLIEVLGFDPKNMPRHSDKDCQVVHLINGTEKL